MSEKFLSAGYLAERAGTSKTTIRRFLRAKGYEGRLDLTLDKADELLEGFDETCSMCCWFYGSKFEVEND